MFNELFGNNYILQDLMQNIMQMYGVLLIYSVLLIIFKVLFMLAIGFDCKSRGDQKQTMWMILCFFFPLPAGIVYGCTRNKDNQPYSKFCHNCGSAVHPDANFCTNCGNMNLVIHAPKDNEKNKKTSKIFFGVSVALYVFAVLAYVIFIFSAMSTAFGTVDSVLDNGISQLEDQFSNDMHYGYTVNGETVYYDREGNAYSDDEDVLYYDRNGESYIYEENKYSFESSETGKIYDYIYCFVDEDGYFVFDAAGAENDYNSTIIFDETIGDYCDEDGNIYYYADEVSWDSEGNLVDNYLGHSLLNAD